MKDCFDRYYAFCPIPNLNEKLMDVLSNNLLEKRKEMREKLSLKEEVNILRNVQQIEINFFLFF